MSPIEGLSGSVSISMKVDCGNYESADAFLSISGVTTETTYAELAELMDGKMKITYDALKVRMGEKIKLLREKH